MTISLGFVNENVGGCEGEVELKSTIDAFTASNKSDCFTTLVNCEKILPRLVAKEV